MVEDRNSPVLTNLHRGTDRRHSGASPMRFTYSLVLLAGLAAVSQGNPAKSQPARPPVPVVKDAILLLRFESGSSARSKGVHETPTPVTSLAEGLSYAQKASRLPILAMSESEG